MSAQHDQLDLRVSLVPVSSASTRRRSADRGPRRAKATIHTEIAESAPECGVTSIAITITRGGGVTSREAGIQARLQLSME